MWNPNWPFWDERDERASGPEWRPRGVPHPEDPESSWLYLQGGPGAATEEAFHEERRRQRELDLGRAGPPVEQSPYLDWVNRIDRGYGAGPFTGRGPKNWKRSDERILEEVCEALTEDGEVDASEIEVGVRDGEVLLGGSVATRREKRRAEEVAERCLGVLDVRNSLRVGTEKDAAQRRSMTG